MKNFLLDADCEIRFTDQNRENDSISLQRVWEADCCKSRLVNEGKVAAHIAEIVLFKGKLPFPAQTNIYGEGYSKLSQYKGTLAEPKLISCVSDRDHYRLPVKNGFFTVYNLLAFLPENKEHALIAFSSCRHYVGEIRFSATEYEVVVDFEGLPIYAGEEIELEDVSFITGGPLQELFPVLAKRLRENHPMVDYKQPIPTGWCSWYSFGADLTEEDVIRNLTAIKEKCPGMKYIQIDEGYAAHEGDWLLPGKTFPSGVKEMCLKIKEMGFEPAMWVGPFIAEIDSQVFREHPEWFVKDETGAPVTADKYTFGGWYHGPWYMLDGTHPGAQDYLRHVFRTMHEEWGVNYFKMDGTMWGALPFGKRYDSSVTRVDAYRMGMKAIREGAGEDSYLLGCNAPMWPSLGTVNAMRLSDDISRSWYMIEKASEEMCWRGWQHQNLWIGDPDCLLLQNVERDQIGPDGTIHHQTDGSVTSDEYRFLATTVIASGGVVISGDDFTLITEENAAVINKCINGAHKAAEFDDLTFSVGRIQLEDKLLITVFNRQDTERDFSISLDENYSVRDFFSGELIDPQTSVIELKAFRPHLGQVFECTRN